MNAAAVGEGDLSDRDQRLTRQPALPACVVCSRPLCAGGLGNPLAALLSPPPLGRAPDSTNRRRTLGFLGPPPRPTPTPTRLGAEDQENGQGRTGNGRGEEEGADGAPPAKRLAAEGGKAVPGVQGAAAAEEVAVGADATAPPTRRQSLLRVGSTPMSGRNGSSRLSLGDLRLRVEMLRQQPR